MRRALLCLSLIGTVLLSVTPADAAGVRPVLQHKLAGLLLERPAAFSLGGSPLQSRNTPLGVASAPAGQSAASLRLPDNSFNPATLVPSYVGTEDNATADGNPFRNYHSQNYEGLKRITGYYERADWTPAGSTTITFRYQASTFANAQDAGTAHFDGVTYVQQQTGNTSQDCQNIVNAPCSFLQFTLDNNNTLKYFAVQVNTCLLETSAEASSAALNANGNQINSTLATITAAAVTNAQRVCTGSAPPPTTVPTAVPTQTVPTPTATSTPTPPPVKLDFAVIAVRVQSTPKEDWNLVTPPLTEVPVGKGVTLAMYWVIRSAPAGLTPTYDERLTRNGRLLVDSPSQGSHPPYDTGSTYRLFLPYTFKQAGKYIFSASVTFGGKTQRASTTFNVVKKVARALPSVSFSFDHLLTQSGNGKPDTHFKAGQTVMISASYTVRNVKTTAPLWITRVYQYPGNGGWRPLGHPIIERSDTANGTHPYSVSFVPSSLYPRQRILIGITVGSQTQKKAVTIVISR